VTAQFSALGDARDSFGADPAPRAVRDVVARGARVRFAEVGAGPPLLLVHDVLEQREAWDPLVPHLARSFRVLAVDLPGFGDSEKPPAARYAYGPQAFAEALFDLLAAAGTPRATVCGHGLGAAVGLTMATTQPSAVDALVLVGAAVSGAETSTLARAAAVPLAGPVFFKQLVGRRVFRRHFDERGRPFDGEDGEALFGRFFASFDTPVGREAAFATLLSLRDRRALLAGLPRVTAPTLVLGGRADPMLAPHDARRLARDLARGRYEAFDGGSFPSPGSAAACAAAITRFAVGPREGSPRAAS
jgi:pimeloyl-ACP methyl ester carboxylesterase